MDYLSLRKQIAYLEALCVAHDAVEAGKAHREVALADERTPAELAAIKEAELLSFSNIAIAGSGFKAELCGTISGEPTATVEKLVEVGFDEKQAADLVAEGKAIRADALVIRQPLPVEPAKEEVAVTPVKEEIKP